MTNSTNHLPLEEITFIESIHTQAMKNILTEMQVFFKDENNYNSQFVLIKPLFEALKDRFVTSLMNARYLSSYAKDSNRICEARMSCINSEHREHRDTLQQLMPSASRIWVLDGIVFKDQVGGLKNIVGLSQSEGTIIDVLNSASSLNLGAENPWITTMDYLEDLLGIRDNFCAAYHPGLRQEFALRKLAMLHPNRKLDVVVHTESSGTLVNCIAIESVAAYSDQNGTNRTNKMILAVNGTWAGGYGAAREATGFGVNDQQQRRHGKNIWIDRCLPPPTKDHKQQFLSIVYEKLKKGEIAGLYIEPDVIGDLGLVSVDKQVLRQIKNDFAKHRLPIILDCVQQLGRSGSYWGENVDQLFSDYPHLVVTTAKSASNGQPFGFVLLPRDIAQAANPLSQITTNQMNGPLLRSIVIAEIMNNPKLHEWLRQKALEIEEIAAIYGFEPGFYGLRGKYLNRGIYMENDELVKLAQISLFIEDGILMGATPHTLRYQPMLLELSETNRNVAHTIFRRLKLIKEGIISSNVMNIYSTISKNPSGLARYNV